MLDTTPALADMASQIRESRVGDGLTLQQLATRSGVAASTIHKVESRQMVPTVSVLLKIAKGLGCRPEELIRDAVTNDRPEDRPEDQPQDSAERSRVEAAEATASPSLPARHPAVRSNVCVWHIDIEAEKRLPTLDLNPDQRAILLMEKGTLDIHAAGKHLQMNQGDCIEVEGTRIQSRTQQAQPARLTLIAAPAGNLDLWLGQPTRSAPSFI